MTIAERRAICALLVKMDRQKDFSKKIGLVDTSVLKKESKKKRTNTQDT